MIKSCEDVRTISDFNEFYNARYNADRVGLIETADILCWDEHNLVCPEVIRLFDGIGKIKND